MRIGITGGRGFIGSRLVAYHQIQGDQIRILSRQTESFSSDNLSLVLADLEHPNKRDLSEFCDGLDVLYHCAGETKNEAAMFRVHDAGTKALVQAATSRVGRWVQLSSVGVYGPQRTGVVLENSPTSPYGTYETSKFLSDCHVIQSSLNFTVLRPSTVFGNCMPNQSLRDWINAIASRKFVFFGAPGAMTNYVHVENVVDALVLCGSLDAANRKTYIVSDSCEIEVFVSYICDGLQLPRPHRVPLWMGKLLAMLPKAPLSRSRLAALTSSASYSNELLKSDLGFTPRVPLREGLLEMLGERAQA